MMKRTIVVFGMIIFALSLMDASHNIAIGQTAQPKLDPQRCADLQNRLDEIVSISQSAAMSDREKMAKLSASLSQSLATMINATSDDPEAAQIAREWRDTLMKVMSSADVSGRARDRDVSAGAKRGVDLIKKRIQPYIAVMKMMCPDLAVPAAITR